MPTHRHLETKKDRSLHLQINDLQSPFFFFITNVLDISAIFSTFFFSQKWETAQMDGYAHPAIFTIILITLLNVYIIAMSNQNRYTDLH